MIILDEKEYVEQVLEDSHIDYHKVYMFLSVYARYLYHEKGYRGNAIKNALDSFMKENYNGYQPYLWEEYFDKYVRKAKKIKLCKCEGIWITDKEIDTIKSINDKVLERLAFTLLCFAKFRNYRNSVNNNWVTYGNREIFTTACITSNISNQDAKISKLRDMGLISFAKRVDNKNVRVSFVDTEEKGDPVLFVSDFRKLGYEWRLFNGEDYIRCAECGILMKRKNNKHRYCKSCAHESINTTNRLFMRNKRKCVDK